MATRLFVILHSIVTLAMFLRVSKKFHSRWSNIDVTLLVLNLFYFCFLVCGDQIVEQYSRFDLTKDLYAMLFVCSFFIWRFLLKNPNIFCDFDVILLMCMFQVMLDEMVTPRYFAVSTDSRVCHVKT